MINNKQLIALGSLIIICIIIWFAGPLIKVAGHQPFLQAEQRFYIITLLFLAWLLNLIFLDVGEPTWLAEEKTDATKKIRVLQGHFHGAIKFLKKTFITRNDKNISLANLPWYLLLGPTGAGKTTLLANANVSFILAKQYKPEALKNISTSDVCEWWVTRDLAIVDVPGNYIYPAKSPASPSQPNRPTGSSLKLWNCLLSLIKRYCHKNTLGGVIIALNLPELMATPQQQEHIVRDLKLRINELKKQFGPQLPFYFVITKCDLIPGFLDFFSDSGSDELSQVWGVTIPSLKAHEKLLDVCAGRFNALIKRINKQLIWRLHQERNTFARPAIKDFPLQVERLKDSLLRILKMLSMTESTLHLCGIYLTSGIQHPVEDKAAATILSNSTATSALQLINHPAMPARAYFIRQLILQGILNTSEYHASALYIPKRERRRRVVYAISGTALLIATAILGNDFRNGLKQTYAIKHGLAQYQLAITKLGPGNSHLRKALPLLNSLQAAATKKSYSISVYSDKSKQTARNAYKQALQVILLPELKNSLEYYMQTSGKKNPDVLYSVLKSYLMLENNEHTQINFIIHTLKPILSANFTKTERDQLSQHINEVFANDWEAVKLNPAVIAEARKSLLSLPSTDLSYIILKNIDHDSISTKTNINTDWENLTIFTLKNKTYNIPHLFTADALQPLLNEGINNAATEALQGNWILGDVPGGAGQMAGSLAMQLQQYYITQYVNFWNAIIDNLQLATPKDLAQLDNMVTILMSDHSPLLQLLQTLKQHTDFPEITNASPKLQALDALLITDNIQESGLYKIFNSLRELHSDLQSISTPGTAANAAAFRIALARMQDPTNHSLSQLRAIAEQSPEPFKNWLNTIAYLSWGHIMQGASKHIDSAWFTNVISVYNTQIANHFPFADVPEDVDLKNFTAFFNKQGTLNQFYRDFFLPFIDPDTNNKMRWRVIDNQKLGFSDKILEQIDQANKIQQAFFGKDNKLTVSFTLQPISLSHKMKSIYLNINGQPLEYDKELPLIPLTVVWPGTINTHSTLINFIGEDNKTVNSTMNGDWGWFRLVNRTTLEITSDSKELLLNFDIGDGYSAKYRLLIQGHFNPFLPTNMQNWRLPLQLSAQN